MGLPRVPARLLLALWIGCAVASLPAAPAAANVAATDLFVAGSPSPSLEVALLECVNADRAAHGLSALAWDPELAAVARTRAVDQLPLERLSHLDGNGEIAAWKLLIATGASYRQAGENLARLPGVDEQVAERAEEALMRSPAHRVHILHPDYNRLGVGTAIDSTGRVVFVQLFRGV